MCPRLLLLLLTLVIACPAQDIIRVDTPDVFKVCKPTHSESDAPCATAPQATFKPNPTYPDKARKSKREGTVTLGLIVETDGTPHSIRVLNSAGDDLDAEAIKAVQQWKFDPGTYQGKTVPVELAVEVNFHLRSNSSSAPPVSTSEEVRNLFTNAQEAAGRRDYGKAAQLARKLVALSPRNAGAYNLLGNALRELHQLDAAAEALETAVKLDPASSYAYNNLARVYWSQRRYEDAILQFQKQIAINADDHYAHANLGMLLRDQKKCSAALPELERALVLTPDNVNVLIALGECHIDTGDRAKGVFELEQATSQASSAGTWNSAAYALAQRNIELERAQKWAETAITVESAQMQNTVLEHLSTLQLSRVNSIASYWDTLGWVYFRRGKNEEAVRYLGSAWSVRQLPVMADHLAQVYESQGKSEVAQHTYALAVAAADNPAIVPLNPDEAAAVEHARGQLSKLDPQQKAVKKLIERAHTDLSKMLQVGIPNTSRLSGSADFVLTVTETGKSTDVRQLSGDPSFARFIEKLKSTQLPMQVPASPSVELPRRATLTCAEKESDCTLALLTADDAVDLSRKQDAAEPTSSAAAVHKDPHTYESASLGMKVSLPDQWQLVQEQPGSFSRPHMAMLGKPGALAFVVLTRERMEGSSDLYSKMLEAGLSQHEEYRRTGQSTVKRDGVDGTRWNMAWKEKNISYEAVMDFFSVGDDRYRLTAMAPSEVFSRYSEDFEDMLRSLKFPLLHADPKLFEKPD